MGVSCPGDKWGRAVRWAGVAAAAGVLVGCVSGCSEDAPKVRTPAAAPASQGKQITIWLTGYSWQDNTPPGSSVVGEPILHKEAGGTGTFADPITVAVPGVQGSTTLKAGTKFYLPTVQRYVIAEDSGAAPPPSQTDTHLDMWIDGRDGTKAATDDCEDQFTGKVPGLVNPGPNMPVMAGPIFSGGKCNIPPQPDDLGTYANSGGAQPVHQPPSQSNGDDGGDGGDDGGDNGGG
jgi:hypothetical protein